MPIDFHQLPHEGIRKLIPYQPGKPIVEVAREFGLKDIIKLASNENPLGCSPSVLNALSALSPKVITSYPSAQTHLLYEALAEKLTVSPKHLLLSNGSDYIFLLLMIGFALGTSKHILTHDYAFSSYSIQAQGLGIPVVFASVRPDLQVDTDQLICRFNNSTSLIFIANPNNPTGLMLSFLDIKKLLSHIPESTLLILDEAYYEYTDEKQGTIALQAEHPNLVITRTFSKAYGLAGLRLGYAIAHPQIIEILHKLQLPFAVNQAALTAGLAALDDTSFIQKTVELNSSGMEQMQAGLEKLHLTYLPSQANFISFECKTDALPVYQQLLAQGIIVRPLHPYKMPQYLRVTIGTKEQNQRFLQALSIILGV